MITVTKLNGIWKLRSFDGQRGDTVERVLAATYRGDGGWDAVVPGSVHGALLRHGIIDEPTLGTNSLKCRWVEENLWYYCRTFDAGALNSGERAWLCFDCLDVGATVYLNGVQVARHQNVFRPLRVEVTASLQPGCNVLTVKVESGLHAAAHRSAEGLGLNPDSEIAKRSWLRKPQYSFGWDWSPRLLTVGIPGEVRLEVTLGPTVDQMTIQPTLQADGHWAVSAGVFLAEASVEECVLHVSLESPELGLNHQEEITLAAGCDALRWTSPTVRPELWWPRGYGDQPLYPVKMSIACNGHTLARLERSIGFRTVRLVQEPLEAGGQSCVVEVNRRKIFLKGANYVPADILWDRIDHARTATLIERAVDSHFNCLRIWGGGLYGDADFYEACDREGIIVWQDFMFACAKYPVWDAGFLEEVKREAVYQIRRLASYPSLCLWCGNNELDWANAAWPTFKKEPLYPDHALFHAILPQLLADEGLLCHYHPSSPWSPPGIDPNDSRYGDQHVWSVGFIETDFRLYRTKEDRLASEGGFLGPTALPTLRACFDSCPSDQQNWVWQHHENAVSYWGESHSGDNALEVWLGLERQALDLEKYAFAAGILQGEALSEYCRNYRRRAWTSGGVLFWMFNDSWPCVRSWTTIDYYLRRTPAFHPVRRAFSPVACVVVRDGDNVQVFGLNDGEPKTLLLEYGLVGLDGSYPVRECRQVELPGYASTLLAEWHAGEWDRRGTEEHLAYALLRDGSALVAGDRLILPLFKVMPWRTPTIRIDWNAGRVTLESDVFVWRVCLDLDGERPLEDNFFDLFPGVPKTLLWPEAWGKPVILATGNTLLLKG